MGGSGNWYRWDSKKTTESTHRIDIRWLKKKGLLKYGVSTSLTWSCRGNETGSIHLNITLESMILNYSYRSQGDEWFPVEQEIIFTKTPCNYGGYRKWFLCSRCGRRVGVLYSAGKNFLCRHCCYLNYGSQHENKAFRYIRKAHNIQERLGGQAGSINPFPKKPSGMHWKTYRHFEANYYKFDSLAWESIGQPFGL